MEEDLLVCLPSERRAPVAKFSLFSFSLSIFFDVFPFYTQIRVPLK